ncbi:MAG: single-stranded DNA-binding protein [Methanobacterium sp.]|nr:single-stranded DNA-binding protein [Methanobacterium sp.]
MNSVNLIGRLVKDPELRYVSGSGTAVSTFKIAVDDFESKDTDYIQIVLWGRRAEALVKNTRQGDLIGVSNGKLKTRSYDATDGTKRYVTEVVAEKIQFCATSRKNQNQEIEDKEVDNMDEKMFKGTALE